MTYRTTFENKNILRESIFKELLNDTHMGLNWSQNSCVCPGLIITVNFIHIKKNTKVFENDSKVMQMKQDKFKLMQRIQAKPDDSKLLQLEDMAH